MGNTVVDSRQGGNPLAAALQYWLGASQRKRAEDEAETQRQAAERQQDNERRLRIAQVEYQNVHPSQRSAYVAGLTPDVQRYFTDTAALPAPVLSPREQAEQMYGERQLKAVQNWQPTPFDESMMNMEGVIGRNPNATWSETERDRAFMAPDVFSQYANEGFVPPSEAEQRRAAAAKDKADAAFTSGPRTSTEYAQGGKYKAETAKIGEETITERESRDPNSPTSKAKSNAAGRKTSAQKAVEDANKALTKLSERETRLITEVVGERAGLKASGQASSPFLKKKEAELAQVRALIQERIDRRNKIVQGATKAGVKTEQDKSQIEFITQAEYDALIGSGETPESIAADGLRVRK